MTDDKLVSAGELASRPQAFALFDYVKLSIFRKYELANESVMKISEGVGDWRTLRKYIVGLYLDYYPKLNRINPNGKKDYGEEFELLKQLEPIIKEHPYNIQKLSPGDTMKMFFLLRELLEQNGITKYEFENRNWMQQVH